MLGNAAQSEGVILQLVQQIGMSAGAKKMLQWEFQHAQESEMNGIYVTWRSEKATDDCFRIGSASKCFCGHLFKDHNNTIGKKKIVNNCQKCDCKGFQFIPRRPEEVGQWWLPRRKGFNVNTWRAPCKCKHGHDEHKPNRPNQCTKCGCSSFQSDFCCIGCDQMWEDHETIYETEQERAALGKPIRSDYYPLAENPQIQQETMKKLGIDGRSAEQKLIEEFQQEQLMMAQGQEPKVSSMGIPMGQSEQEIILNPGRANMPQVSMIVDTKKNYNPKQNLQKPEKSVQIMQQRGIAGQGNSRAIGSQSQSQGRGQAIGFGGGTVGTASGMRGRGRGLGRGGSMGQNSQNNFQKF